MLLKDKVAILYGAAGGIGTGVAHAFAREGARLFLTGRTEATLQALAAEINAAGGQADFVFKAPTTKKYTFQTFGHMDTVMVLFEKGKKENYYLAGDDDSGFEKNTSIEMSLVRGRDYLVRVRVMYTEEDSASGIVVF